MHSEDQEQLEYDRILENREHAERLVREIRDEMQLVDEDSEEYASLESEMYYAENEEIYWQHRCENVGLM